MIGNPDGAHWTYRNVCDFCRDNDSKGNGGEIGEWDTNTPIDDEGPRRNTRRE